MDILFDEARLLQLVTNLYVLTGITANILDPQGRDIHLFKDHPPFCRAINDLPEGHRRCVRCDMWKVANYNAEKGFQFYRCHAGICEAVLPLYDRQQPLAYLVFGCFLDDSPKEVQWEHTRGRLSWYPGLFPVPPILHPAATGLLRDAGGPFRLHPASGDDFAHRADGSATAGAVH